MIVLLQDVYRLCNARFRKKRREPCWSVCFSYLGFYSSVFFFLFLLENSPSCVKARTHWQILKMRNSAMKPPHIGCISYLIMWELLNVMYDSVTRYKLLFSPLCWGHCLVLIGRRLSAGTHFYRRQWRWRGRMKCEKRVSSQVDELLRLVPVHGNVATCTDKE
jgi:hypothetical protein